MLRTRAHRGVAVVALATGGALLSASIATSAEPSHRRADLPPVGSLSPSQYSVMPITEENIQLAVDSLDGIARQVMRRSHVPGMAVAVVHDGEIVYAKGFGVRELGRPAHITPETVFQVASVSKSVGATVVARAVGQGIVKWTDPVRKYLPGFELSDPAVTRMVTIGDLFSHRSGIPATSGDDLEGLGFTRSQIIHKLRMLPLEPFRTSYGYANFGLTTGAVGVARAASTSWAKLSRQLIYEPLGMSSTSSRYADFLRESNRATLHARVKDGFAPKYIRDADAQAPAGGVSSNVLDMSKWMMLTLASGKWDGERLIKKSALLPAHTAQSVNSPAQAPDARSGFYGYGFNVDTTSSGQVRWGHSGAFIVGASTAFGMLPAGDVGIVALTNAAPVGAAEAVTVSFTDLARTGEVERDWLDYYGGLFDQLYVNNSPVAKPPPANPEPPRRPGAYVGTYTNRYFGDVTVRAAGSRLMVTVGPDDQRAAARHYDGDVFAWLPPGGNADPVSAVTFAGDVDGKARTVTLEYLAGSGYGSFWRR